MVVSIMDDTRINQILEQGIQVADAITKKYHYPSNITHLLYLIIPAFLIKYGSSNEKKIIKSFIDIPIIIDDKQDEVYQAYYVSMPSFSDNGYFTNKGIVLKNYKNISLMQLLDNLVHEFNHAINSINQEIKILNDNLYIRTGLTFIIYDKNNLKVIGKKDNSILEEIINTKQTEIIIDIINSFNQYNISNREITNTLYAIESEIKDSYQSNAYLLQSLVCRSLIENKTFFSTLENLRFIGEVDEIETWFDSITGKENSYLRLTEILKITLDLQIEITKKQGVKIFKLNKIKKLNSEAMEIVHLFDKNCNYR